MSIYIVVVNSLLYLKPTMISRERREELGKDAFVTILLFLFFFVNGFFGWNVTGRARVLIEKDEDLPTPFYGSVDGTVDLG